MKMHRQEEIGRGGRQREKERKRESRRRKWGEVEREHEESLKIYTHFRKSHKKVRI